MVGPSAHLDGGPPRPPAVAAVNSDRSARSDMPLRPNPRQDRNPLVPPGASASPLRALGPLGGRSLPDQGRAVQEAAKHGRPPVSINQQPGFLTQNDV